MMSKGKIKRVMSNPDNDGQGDEKVQKVSCNDSDTSILKGDVMNAMPSSPTKVEDGIDERLVNLILEQPSEMIDNSNFLAENHPIAVENIQTDDISENEKVTKTMVDRPLNYNKTQQDSHATVTEIQVTEHKMLVSSKETPDVDKDKDNAKSMIVEPEAGLGSAPDFVRLTRPLTSSVHTNSTLTENMSSSSPNLSQIAKDDEKKILTMLPTMIRRTVSDGSSNSSAETSNTTTGQNSVSGNWGWFEDVHGGHNTPDNENIKTGAESGKKGKKKKGLLPCTDAPLDKPFDSYVDSQPKEISGAVTAPLYVLEESPSTQKLWKDTAGGRPPQPVEERAFFEKMWTQNFVKSQAIYYMPVEVLTATSPISLSPFADGNFPEDTRGQGNDPTAYTYSKKIDGIDKDKAPNNVEASQAEANLVGRLNGAAGALGYGSHSRTNNLKSLGPHHHHHTLVNKKVRCEEDGELCVVVRGDNVFGTTVSKSFALKGGMSGADTVSISVASYRVVESKKHGKYAQFLVIYCEGGFRDTVGVWKRYSDFDKLSQKVTKGAENCSSVLVGINPLHTSSEDFEHEILPNAITSWRLLKKRKRWYRCLDAGYLSLKVFLLERFLHDILFESSSPQLLRDFVGIDMRDNKVNIDK